MTSPRATRIGQAIGLALEGDLITLLEIARVALNHGISEAQARELDLSDGELNRLALKINTVMHTDTEVAR